MKKTALLFIVVLCMSCFSGCSFFFEEPSALILPPASDQEEYTEHTLVNSFLSDDEHLQVPEHMEDPAAFIDIDVDGDDVDEKLAFWSNTSGHEVGALLVKQQKDGTWNVVDQLRQYGNAIDFFALIDIDRDDEEEACIGINVGGYNVLSAYELSDDGFSEIAQIDYSFMNIVDVNGDGYESLLCTLNNYDDTSPTTTLYQYDGGESLQCVYQKDFDGNCMELTFGNVGHGRQGLYLVRSNNYSDLNVDLLLPKADGGFDEQLTARVQYVNSISSGNTIEDVSGDGVLDVRSVVEPVEASNRDENDYLRIWKTWNGEGELENVYGVLENGTDGYTFVLPKNWLDSVRYQFVSDKGVSQVRFFDGSAKEPAVVLYAATEAEAETIQNMKDVVSLGTSPSSQRVYYALCNTEKFAGEVINRDGLKQLFQIEGGQ